MNFMDLSILYFGTPLKLWLIALSIAVGMLLIVRLLQAFFVHMLSKRRKAQQYDIYEFFLAAVKRTRFSLTAVLAIYAGTRVLSIPAKVDIWVSSTAMIALLIQVGLWASEAVTFWFKRSENQFRDTDPSRYTTMRAAAFIVRLIVIVIISLLALDNIPGVEITALVASLGIGGIAVALAVQNILSDLFASLSIVMDKPFVVGDFIIVDTFLGTVERIGLKTTHIRSLSGERLIFSNNDLLKSRIRNYKHMIERRVVFSIGVTYQTPAEKLSKIPIMIRKIIESQESVRFDRAHFRSYGNFALEFEIVYYVLAADYNIYMDIQQAVNLEIYRQFESEGISFAYPTQTLYVKPEGSEHSEVAPQIG